MGVVFIYLCASRWNSLIQYNTRLDIKVNAVLSLLQEEDTFILLQWRIWTIAHRNENSRDQLHSHATHTDYTQKIKQEIVIYRCSCG